MQQQLWLASLVALAAMAPAHGETAPKEVVFVEGAIEASLTSQPGNPEAGATVMRTASLGNCVACHQLDAMPDMEFQGDIAPQLDGAADRWSEAQLRGIVANAKMTFDGTFMPAFFKTEGFVRPGNAYSGKAPEGPLPPIMSAQQVEDVVAYLLTLKD